MIDTAGLQDLRNYIKRRVAYGRYRVGSTYYKCDLSDVQVLSNGTVRAQMAITGGLITVNRVELFNSDQQMWAHSDCSITLKTGQTGILYWFDFNIYEKPKEG